MANCDRSLMLRADRCADKMSAREPRSTISLSGHHRYRLVILSVIFLGRGYVVIMDVFIDNIASGHHSSDFDITGHF